MEARKPRHIRHGNEFDELFPGANRGNQTIRRNANLDDTVVFIPKVVKDTLEQTEGITRRLKGRNVYDTCKNIWHFVYDHIQYKKDEEGFEQIRSPARTWHDREEGVDCDCYSVFISSILTNLGIAHTLRITKYSRKHFQHIYPVVPHGSRHITLDCVTDQFDFEVPYSEKKDFPMDLQYLDGLDGLEGHTLGLFGKKKKKKAAAAAAAAAASLDPNAPPPPPKKKKKGFFKKVLNVVNKINPATLLLRNGVLAAMKLNIKNVAKRLRWSYLPADKIAQHGIDPAKYQKLVNTRMKLENIFYGAGGNPKNLRKAILNGKGNKDKAVSGLGMLPMQEWTGVLNEYSSLGELLGDEIYHSENVEGMEGFGGFGELGEPISLASIGAAMGVIAGIVSALKQIGSIFKGKEKGSEDFDEALTDSTENNVNASAAASAAAAATAAANTAPVTAEAASLPAILESDTSSPADSGDQSYAMTTQRSAEVPEPEADYSTAMSTPTGSGTPAASGNTTPKTGFWDKNKKWLKPVAIGVGGLTLIAIGYKLIKSKKAAPKSSKAAALSGLPRKRKKKGRKKHNRIKAVALL
ncbi:MAG: hypothetical protein J0H92_20910 [Sphingobacteriales bacterium]|nr:hypothetical protein [Sphingobacteriales bacterium]OJW35507.1 MAG: hypothetical protein BGO54_04145 [Sphingobacteriales bacterium 46-32]